MVENENRNGRTWFWKVLGCILIVVSLYGGMKGLEQIFVTQNVYAVDMAGMVKSLDRVNLNSEVVFHMQTIPIKQAAETKAKNAYEEDSTNPIKRQEWINKTQERRKAEDDLKRAEELRRKCQ